MILIVDMNWKKDSLGYYEFVEPLVAVAKKFEEVKVEQYSEIKAEDLIGVSRVILSGTTLKDTAFLQEPKKFGWLKEVDTPVLGICAGMEAIGLAFGLRLVCSLEIGMTQITTSKENSLFSGAFKAYTLHNYAVEPSKEFWELAKSVQCVQAFKHKQKPIYGILFHPEVRNEDVLKRFITLC